MITPLRIVAAAGIVLVAGLFTTMGHSQDARWQAIRDNQRVESGLQVVMIGDIIVNGCDELGVRRFRSTPFMLGLAREAMGLGYSRAEVEEFIDDPVERARVEAGAEAWLAQRGASRGDAASLCRIGRSEMAAESTIGRMLREE